MLRHLQLGCLLICFAFNVYADEPQKTAAISNKQPGTSRQDEDAEIDFNQKIRPLLANHCLNCHGPDEKTREAGLRLDRFEDAVREAESGEFPIVPGSISKSELARRISLEPGDSERMPPTGKGLSPEEVELFRQWIAQGANYAKHWAFVKPAKTELPQVQQTNWTNNAIDFFVLNKLEEKSIRPERPADRYILVRRVYLDLTGIPPTPEEADLFVNDSSVDAYERMVDRVLASPRVGERWARVWLDLARYADSQGYAQDSPRRIYRYRDWVIDAINRNISFDQFTIEQIAGDMLDDPTNDQILATAFHRNTMTNSEGGTDDEEFRTAAIVDRVNSTMQIWMGMTMGCAQCHSHKYDPISQDEYFQVFSILNQTEDADRGNEAPLHGELSESRIRQQESIKKQIETLKEKLLKQPAKKSSWVPPQGKLKARFVRVQGLGEMFLHLAEVEAFVGNKNVAVAGKARQSTTAFGGPANLGNDGKTDGDFLQKSVTHTAEEQDPWWEVDLGAAKEIDKVSVWNRTDSDGVRLRLKKFRVILYDENRKPIWIQTTDVTPNPSSSFSIPKNGQELSTASLEQLKTFWDQEGKGTSGEEKQIAELEAQLKKISQQDITTPIMKQLPADKQRETRIQIRGNFRNPGKVVGPGTPSVFHQIKSRGEKPDRLDFARWLVSRDNPVTSRVIVNRFWENLFGTGIVETSEDFGTQGELPSHPQLLDFLAVDFMDHDWDVKWLLKTIVTSSTYRQSSRVSPELRKLDPKNRWLARGPRARLPAEMIRDQALFVSGSLSTKMNGPSVRPPRPKLGLRAAFGGSTDWETSPGEDAYRRGLYTTWRRTSPYPSMTTFDAPSREFCTLRRSRTNTPLQALVTLNDPVFVNAARQLADITLRAVDDDESRMKYLFRRVLVRPANEKELQFLLSSLRKIESNIDMENAQQLVGTTPNIGKDSKEFAAWMVIGNVILNLDETLARP